MSEVIIRTMDGGRTILNRRTLDRLGATLRGELLDRRAATYDQARSIWNARIDHRPAPSHAAIGPPTSSGWCASRASTSS